MQLRSTLAWRPSFLSLSHGSLASDLSKNLKGVMIGTSNFMIFHACEEPKLWIDINSKSNKLFNKTCIWKHNSTNTTFMRSSNTT
ncbi:nuclear pore complex protein NUP98A isoform X1 [Iris pallida]|uniref:Nuclear pore complex protein NUP98A isoform X1 n=1 Tax=Iris pallida TaxID=29817 RepID=A0AAX6GYN9_IRIPA|nr:nuclear pore complex protein NUP98A isoform X1 [Iris pallida]KAJ6848138.1 nuclear pore complex protein NUP98A isoform X1 [Iris pallida]